jgi:hypothetical protein
MPAPAPVPESAISAPAPESADKGGADMKPWLSNETDPLLITELLHQADVKGKRAQNGFKPEAWKDVVAMFKKHGISRTVESCKERLRFVSAFLM